MRRSFTSALLAVLLAAAALPATSLPALADDGTTLFFPIQVDEDLSYTDTWGAPRGSRTHTGQDLMHRQMAQIYASEPGTIYSYDGDCHVGEYCSSFSLLLSGDDGRSYFYVHLNNDTPGRPNGCDGIGGVDAAFSPRLAEHWKQHGTLKGLRVERGEHIAYNGSSGNAGCGVDHLHYEVWNGHGWGAPKVNPYDELQEAQARGNFWGPDGAPPPPVATSRVAGSDRLRTSVELSKAAFSQAQTVVIAPAEVYPEALVAAPLASVMNAPVLLAWGVAPEGGAQLVPAVAAEITRLGATYAVLVGAPDRLATQLEAEIVEKTDIEAGSIRRIQGADRYALAREVAEQVMAAHGVGVSSTSDSGSDTGSDLPLHLLTASDTSTASESTSTTTTISPVLALGEHPDEGRGWPDALAASVLAARDQAPVLLTQPDVLPAATRDILASEHIGEVRIVGGPQAVSDAVEQDVREDHGKTTRRIAGATRYGTSHAIAAEYAGASDVSLSRLFVATGRNFPDALAAGPALGRLGRVLVLIDGEDTRGSGETYAWARDRAGAIEEVSSVGGYAAVSDEVLELFARYANWPR